MRLTNGLEPPELIRHFIHHPPDGFETFVSSLGQPGFRMRFNLLTTADAEVRRRVAALPGASFVQRLLTWRTVFFGTTVSEYLPLMPEVDAETTLRSMLASWNRATRLLIVKDIPEDSPLLPEAERHAAEELAGECQRAGFTLIAGQALAYVSIDFASEDDYLSRLSAGRRRDIRRKLKTRADLRVETITTGCDRLNSPEFLRELYQLYAEVYAQSEIHFDRLTPEFFTAVLQDKTLDGQLFLYYAADRLIGFNLCFIHNGMLIDKYVGFSYPAARDCNLYFVSWMENLRFALSRKLTHYVAGWTDPEIKAYLGARFTFTRHAVLPRNVLLRRMLGRLSKHFEHDKAWFEARQR